MRIDTSHGIAKAQDPIKPGKYTALIETAEEGISKGGHPQYKIVHKIVGGSEDGRKITSYHLTDNEVGAKKMCALITYLGLPLNENTDYLSSHFEGKHIGIVVGSEVTNDTYANLHPWTPYFKAEGVLPQQTSTPTPQEIPQQTTTQQGAVSEQLIPEEEIPF